MYSSELLGQAFRQRAQEKQSALKVFPARIPSAACVGQARPHFPQSRQVLLVDPDFEDAEILDQPAEQPERAYKHAIRPILDQGEPENEDDEDGSRDPEVPFEEFEGIKVPI